MLSRLSRRYNKQSLFRSPVLCDVMAEHLMRASGAFRSVDDPAKPALRASRAVGYAAAVGRSSHGTAMIRYELIPIPVRPS